MGWQYTMVASGEHEHRILFVGQNEEFQDEIQNVLYAAGIGEFNSVMHLGDAEALLKTSSYTALIIDVGSVETRLLENIRKIVFLVSLDSVDVLLRTLRTKTCVLRKPLVHQELLRVLFDSEKKD